MMNELLRLANELIELHTERGLWPFEHSKDTIYVIKGYQDLLRRMAVVLDIADSYIDDPYNVLGSRVDDILEDAWAALPEIDKNG